MVKETQKKYDLLTLPNDPFPSTDKKVKSVAFTVLCCDCDACGSSCGDGRGNSCCKFPKIWI